MFLLWAAAALADPLPAAPDPASVTAADDARARELFQNGARLYDEGRYEDAIVAWQEAWRLSGRPVLLYNMANAAERIARWRDAMDLLSRYRAFAPAEERDVLDRRIANIERRLEEAEEAPAVAPPPVATPAPTPPPAPAPSPARTRALPIALFGAGGAGIVTGTVFGFRALDARNDAGAICREVDGATWCSDDARTALATDRQSALAADIAFGVGIGAVAGGVLALVLPHGPVAVGLDVRPDGGVVALRGELP